MLVRHTVFYFPLPLAFSLILLDDLLGAACFDDDGIVFGGAGAELVEAFAGLAFAGAATLVEALAGLACDPLAAASFFASLFSYNNMQQHSIILNFKKFQTHANMHTENRIRNKNKHLSLPSDFVPLAQLSSSSHSWLMVHSS